MQYASALSRSITPASIVARNVRMASASLGQSRIERYMHPSPTALTVSPLAPSARVFMAEPCHSLWTAVTVGLTTTRASESALPPSEVRRLTVRPPHLVAVFDSVVPYMLGVVASLCSATPRAS